MIRTIFVAVCGVFLAVSSAAAQGQQTGTLQGTATDTSALPLPGVTVTARSTALQGAREAVTGPTGEFVIRGIPPGTYDVQFALGGFTTGQQTVTVALGLPTQVDARLAPAGVTEQVDVVAETTSTLITPAASANYEAREVDTLATGRTMAAIAELAPGLTANTPNADQVTISGAFSYDNVFLVDGVDINDNLFGSPDDLFIEEAIEQTQVLTSGVSAEYGRFSGGVINAVTKSGGNTFSGSFRTDLTNPAWRDESPFEEASETTRPDDLGQVFQATLGGPILRDRLWFFAAGRWEDTLTSAPLPQSGLPYDRSDKDRRYEGKATATLTPGHTVQGSYFRNRLEQQRVSFPFSVDPATSVSPETPSDRVVVNYRGVMRRNLFGEVQYSRKRLGFRNTGGTSPNLVDSPFITLTQDLGHYNAPYFDATDPEDRDNQQFTGAVSWFLSGGRTGSHDVKAGLEHFTATNTGGNSQSSTGYVFDADYLADDSGTPIYDNGRFVPVFVPGETYYENWLPVRGATIDITTMSLYAQDRWTPRKQLALDMGIRYERVRSDATGGIVGVNTDTVVPRLAATYDVKGDGRYIAQASYAHYAGKYSEAQFSGNTNVGNPSRVFAFYTGPAGQGLDFAPGFDLANYETFLGIFPTANVFFEDGLSAPVTREFTASLGTELGRGYVKGTYVWRNTTTFVEDFVTLENGSTDVVFEGVDFGSFQNRVYRNSDDVERRYQGLVLQGRLDLRPGWKLYANSTVQFKNDGNFEGEATNQPGVSSVYGDYPEAFNETRHYPVGRLSAYQRHKARVWTTHSAGLGRFGTVDTGFAYRYDSALSYSLVAQGLSLTDTQAALLAGYASTTSAQTIYFGQRGSELFPNGSHLFDLAVTYSLPLMRTLRPYVKLDVRNVFDSTPLISHDTTLIVDENGPLDALGLPTTYTRGPRFGQATSNTDYPFPREFRVSFGFRF